MCSCTTLVSIVSLFNVLVVSVCRKGVAKLRTIFETAKSLTFINKPCGRLNRYSVLLTLSPPLLRKASAKLVTFSGTAKSLTFVNRLPVPLIVQPCFQLPFLRKAGAKLVTFQFLSKYFCNFFVLKIIIY